MDLTETVVLIVLGIASIRADVLLAHISHAVETIAAAKVKRVAPVRKDAPFMQAHPNGKPIVK